MTQPRIDLPMDQIEDFCRRWHITEFALFGSVLRDDFRPDSDVDVLVTFAPGTHWPWGGFGAMTAELERILGRVVDIVTRPAVEQSDNYILRRRILSELEPVYVA